MVGHDYNSPTDYTGCMLLVLPRSCSRGSNSRTPIDDDEDGLLHIHTKKEYDGSTNSPNTTNNTNNNTAGGYYYYYINKVINYYSFQRARFRPTNIINLHNRELMHSNSSSSRSLPQKHQVREVLGGSERAASTVDLITCLASQPSGMIAVQRETRLRLHNLTNSLLAHTLAPREQAFCLVCNCQADGADVGAGADWTYRVHTCGKCCTWSAQVYIRFYVRF